MNKKNLKDFVEAGYKSKSDAKTIGNYILDEDLSTKRNKIYYDPNTGKAVHTIAGTDSMTDWSNNALIPVGLHEYSNRHKNSEKIQNKANEKYGKENVDLVSHSQSGHIAENLANKNLVGGQNTTLNPAIIGSHNKDVTVYKSIFDPVSLLTDTNKNDYNIIPKTFNPITEHSTNILDKTRKNIFGFGLKALKKSDVNKIMNNNYDSDSSSDDGMEGCGINEMKILKKMQALHKDIAKLHQKEGVKKSVVKGFKALGMGIINSANKPAVVLPVEPKMRASQLKKLMDADMSGFVANERATTAPTPRKFKGGELFSTAGLQKKGGNDGMTKEETREAKDKEKYTNAEAMQNANKSLEIYNKGGYNTKKLGFGIQGCGASGKMLKNAAVNSTAGLLNSAATRAMYEMDNKGKKGTGIKKGSPEMKERMRKMREMRKCNKG